VFRNLCKYRSYPKRKNITRDHSYLIIELRDVIEYYDNLEQYFTLYRKFPLKDIISILLSVKQEQDYSDYIFSELEDRLGDLINSIDLNYLELFFELLIKDVDDEIKSKCPNIINTSEFILEEWINNYTVILKKIK